MTGRSAGAVRLYLLPRLRYLLAAWGVVFGCAALTIGILNLRNEPGIAVVGFFLAGFGFWLARRWLTAGVTVSAERVRVKGMLLTKEFDRRAVKQASVYRRSFAVAWLLGQGEVSIALTVASEPVYLGRFGLASTSKEQAREIRRAAQRDPHDHSQLIATDEANGSRR